MVETTIDQRGVLLILLIGLVVFSIGAVLLFKTNRASKLGLRVGLVGLTVVDLALAMNTESPGILLAGGLIWIIYTYQTLKGNI